MPPYLKDAPRFLLGINYWSRSGGPRMWERDRFDLELVRRELAQMRRIGLNTCRSFTFIPTFMPTPGAVDDAALSRYRSFLAACADEGVSTIPSFLVGHMSGENHDFVEQRGRCLYSDRELIDWQLRLIRAVAGAAAAEPAVIAYLASNEMPLWGGRDAPETIAAWARRLRDGLREVDGARPFSLGDGAMNLSGGQNGFDALALADVVDFFGPHTYHADSDPYRAAMNAELCVRSMTHFGLPVLLEEFGCSSCQTSEEGQAIYYREAIHGCLSAGAAGALGWCYSDFDLVHAPPYSHHAFELGFGITRADGSEKPVCDELRAISRLIEGIDSSAFEPPRPRAAIVVPSYFNTRYPFSWEDRARMRRTLLQSYVLCVKAGVEAELVPEQRLVDDRVGARYRLLLAPATQKLLAPTWRALLELARAGATVYWSYFGGDYSCHQGAWCHDFSALTGCAHSLRYGCFDLPGERLALNGDELQLDVSTVPERLEPYPRAYLPIEPLPAAGAEVIARDSAGRVALTRARRGEGSVYFCNHPLEHYLAEQAEINDRDRSEQLYRLLARDASLQGPVRCDEPAVQARVVDSGAGALLWLINHGWKEARAKLDAPAGEPLHGTGQPLSEGGAVDLAPKQVAVYRLSERTQG